MLLSNRRILDSVSMTLERLQCRSDLPQGAAFDLQAAITLLRHLQHVDASEGTDLLEYAATTSALLRSFEMDGKLVGKFDGNLASVLDETIEAADTFARSDVRGDALKREFAGLVARADGLFSNMSDSGVPEVQNMLANIVAQLMDQHSKIAYFERPDADRREAAVRVDEINEQRLTKYLREKLQDDAATASKVTILGGGYSKETTLFTISSATLNDNFVLRRDTPADIFSGLDVHSVPDEFRLLRILFERGIPIAEPMFCENSSDIINGPAFGIMRMVSGATTGDIYGSDQRPPAELQRTLAQVMARVHLMEPLTDLNINATLEPSLWTKPAGECARNYINAWYRRYKAVGHLPIPALHGMFNWLLENIPIADGRPALIHADFGFHNLLFDDGQLTAVLDWEFAHVGHPAEDIGYMRSAMGNQLDWPQFIADYGEAGGVIPSEECVDFFEIWANVKIATSGTMGVHEFVEGRTREIKWGNVVYGFLPHFLDRARTLIEGYGKG
jgi:aminoglycoside phosphotransferase (APT) family kinase protein